MKLIPNPTEQPQTPARFTVSARKLQNLRGKLNAYSTEFLTRIDGPDKERMQAMCTLILSSTETLNHKTDPMEVRRIWNALSAMDIGTHTENPHLKYLHQIIKETRDTILAGFEAP